MRFDLSPNKHMQRAGRHKVLGRGRVSGRLLLFGPEYTAGPTLNDLSVEMLLPLNASATPTVPADLSAEFDFSLDAFVDETS